MALKYEYNVYVINFRKCDYGEDEEVHPRVLEEKNKLKQEIDQFYHLILSYLTNLN